MSYKFKSAKTSTGLTVVVSQDHYTGLWSVKYEDGGKFAGPYKTKREALQRMAELCDVEA